MNKMTFIKRTYARDVSLTPEEVSVRLLLGFLDNKDHHVIITTTRVLTKLMCNNALCKNVEDGIVSGLLKLERKEIINIERDDEVLIINLLDSVPSKGTAYIAIKRDEFISLSNMKCNNDVDIFVLIKLYMYVITTFRWDLNIKEEFQNKFSHCGVTNIAKVFNKTTSEIRNLFDTLVNNNLLYIETVKMSNDELDVNHNLNLIMRTQDRYLLSKYIRLYIKDAVIDN